ncbi:MAG: hypothetical protein Q8865_03925 [Bacillota bacterium]|nr:hypothetical protein [Bacillota bacterium]
MGALFGLVGCVILLIVLNAADNYKTPYQKEMHEINMQFLRKQISEQECLDKKLQVYRKYDRWY